jgi:hypothetical protein
MFALQRKGSSTIHAVRISFLDAGRLKGGEKEYVYA